MMKHIYLGLLLLFIPFTTFGSGENYLIGARSAGMAHASVTLSDLWSAHHNQAGLAGVKTISGGVFYESRFLLPELGLKGGAVAIPVGEGTFGLNISSFGYSKFSESKYGLAYARNFGEKFSAGIQMDYLHVRIGEEYGSKGAFAVEAGVQAKLTDELTIGAHVFNPNRAKIADYEDERMPTIMRVGLNYEFSDKVFVVLETEKDIDHKPVVRAGMEYQPAEILYFRIGVASNPFLTSFGFGLNIKEQFKLDFATSYHSTLGYSPQISLSYSLK